MLCLEGSVVKRDSTLNANNRKECLVLCTLAPRVNPFLLVAFYDFTSTKYRFFDTCSGAFC